MAIAIVGGIAPFCRQQCIPSGLIRKWIDVPDTDTIHSYDISWWRGEFVDQSVEAGFRWRRASDVSRHAAIAVIAGAVLYLSFWYMDQLAMPAGAAVSWLLAIRGSIFLLGLAIGWLLVKYPIEAERGRLALLFEACGLLSFAAVMTIRGEPLPYYGMSIAILLTGIYLLIPNRVVYILALCGTMTLCYVGLLLLAAHKHPQQAVSDLIMVLITFNVLGYMATLRLAIGRRKEFRLVLETERTNKQLTQEIKQRRDLERKLNQLATTDSLTGVYNRREYIDLSRHALMHAKRSGQTLAVLMFDLDYFKQVNDSYGHAVGDEALRVVAQSLRKQLRTTDILARFGGEEFTLTLQQTSAEHATATAERIRAIVADRPIPGTRADFRLTVTVGVAIYDGEDETMEELIERADTALYEGKAAGRDCVVALAS